MVNDGFSPLPNTGQRKRMMRVSDSKSLSSERKVKIRKGDRNDKVVKMRGRNNIPN